MPFSVCCDKKEFSGLQNAALFHSYLTPRLQRSFTSTG
jgi:hypothetical protein